MRWILISAAVLGAISVMIAAVSKHLGSDIDADILQTAIRYHQNHSILLVALGLYSLNKPLSKKISITAALFLLGIIIFSGSLYLMAILNIPALGHFTPLGGVMLILGWLSLIALAFEKS